jgi:hypothetical protein
MTESAPAPRRPRPSAGELLHEIHGVITDIPRFATAPLYRRRHLRWGATDDEVRASMPGDEVITHPKYLATRAITINAPPPEVWPWLVQVGTLRAGFYANDLLDNLGHPSSWTILPEFQRLEISQWVPMSPTPSDTTAFKVAGFEVDRWLLWRQPLSTWSLLLTPTPVSSTRLVTRLRTDVDWHHPAISTLTTVLNEFGDYPMMRRMLLGIRERAEATRLPQAGDAGAG